MDIVSALDDAGEAELLLRVRSIALRRIARIVDDATAEDIAQDIVLQLIGRVRAGTLRRRTLKAFVRRRAFSRAMNMLRRNRHRGERDALFLREITDSVREWMSPDVAMDADELESVVERTRSQLPSVCRDVYAKVREEKQSYRDVARRVGVTRSAVCAHVSEAQNRFRVALRQHGVEMPAAVTRPAATRRPVVGTGQGELRRTAAPIDIDDGSAGGTSAAGTNP